MAPLLRQKASVANLATQMPQDGARPATKPPGEQLPGGLQVHAVDRDAQLGFPVGRAEVAQATDVEAQ